MPGRSNQEGHSRPLPQDSRYSAPPPCQASASVSALASASAPSAPSTAASGLPSFSSDFCQPSAGTVGQSPGSQQYSPPGSTNFHEEDHRTGEQ